MEESSVEFATDCKSTLLIPAKGRTVVAEVAGERLQLPCRVGEFKDPCDDKVSCPAARYMCVFKCLRGQNRQLLYYKETEVCTPHGRPGYIIEYHAVEVRN